MREAAPEWYDARKVEISGAGYPSIADIPTITATTRPGQQLRLSEAEVLRAYKLFTEDPRSAGAQETAEEMRIWASATRRAVEGQVPAPDFLTDDDVAALKAIFRTPRGRL